MEEVDNSSHVPEIFAKGWNYKLQGRVSCCVRIMIKCRTSVGDALLSQTSLLHLLCGVHCRSADMIRFDARAFLPWTPAAAEAPDRFIACTRGLCPDFLLAFVLVVLLGYNSESQTCVPSQQVL